MGPMSGTIGITRFSGAPISWGVCEAPGWGLMLTPARVLPEMTALGLTQTELGAPGFFPDDVAGVLSTLAAHQLAMVGGFVPLVLHDPSSHDLAVKTAHEWASKLQAIGGKFFVTAVIPNDEWKRPAKVTSIDIANIAKGLKLVDEVVAQYGLTQVIHPHVDTMIETKDDVDQLISISDVKWCLDTGHLAVGGYDVVEFAEKHASRVAHVHVKDVKLDVAARCTARELSLLKAVQAGMFPPLGEGNVPIANVLSTLEKAGYQGLYVLEQDLAITDGEPAVGTGPIIGMNTTMSYLSKHGFI